MKNNHLIDKTTTHKIGNKIYIVSSFVRTDNSITAQEALKRLIKKDLTL